MSLRLGKFRAVARRARAAVSSRAVILLYHRVADAPPGTDVHNLCVSPARFAEQMEALRRSVRVLPLAALAKHVADATLPHRSAAVTFDDGYADNLRAAKPILERLGVPATVFATTGSVGRIEEFYWDECQRIISAAPEITFTFEATAGPRPFHVGAPGSEARRRAVVDLCETLLRDGALAARAEVMRQVRAWAGVAPQAVRPTHRAMSDDEVRQLADGGLIEVGAHTENHPALPSLPPAEQAAEIVRSKERLESVLGRPVTSFAYPYGLHTDETVRAVGAAGFERACTTEEHAARHASEALRLPRFDMGDCDGETFARKLRWAFGR